MTIETHIQDNSAAVVVVKRSVPIRFGYAARFMNTRTFVQGAMQREGVAKGLFRSLERTRMLVRGRGFLVMDVRKRLRDLDITVGCMSMNISAPNV